MGDVATSSSFPHAPRQADEPYRLAVAGHAFTVFVGSPALLSAMLDDMHRAQRRIWLESYILADDDAGRRAMAVLEERARAGVDVRVLYDAVGSLTTRSGLFAGLLAAGGAVHAYHGFWDALRKNRFLTTLGRRNHRKLLVIDEEVGYFGGMNLVDVGPKPHRGDAAQPIAASGWRDVHLRMQGPQQADLAESFSRSWNRARGEKVPPRSRAYRKALLAPEAESIRFFDSGPGRRNTRAARVFARLLGSARQRVMISMAYFVPTGRVLRALLAARRRGVRVAVVMPSTSDVPIVDWAATHLGDRLIKRGFRIYRHARRMLHSKLVVVDGQWTIVGSSNLDSRSMWYNLEFLAVIRSQRMAQFMEALVGDDISQSRRLTSAELAARSRWQRLRDRLAYALRWWL